MIPRKKGIELDLRKLVKNSFNLEIKRRERRVFSSNHGTSRVPHSLIKLPAVFIEHDTA